MRSLLGTLCLVALAGLAPMLGGCGKTYEETLASAAKDKTVIVPPAGAAEEKARKPIVAKAFDGVLTGKVIFARSENPAPKSIDMKDGCEKAKNPRDLMDQRWFVGAGKGVEYAVVFLRAGDDFFFPVVEEDKKREGKDVKFDQPFCQYHPQVRIHYPHYIDADGKKRWPTGEKLLILNTGELSHNVNFQGDPLYGNPRFNSNLPAGKTIDDKVIEKAQPTPIPIGCNIHPWMSAYLWTFEHPYAAVTDADGNFTIKNLPTGVDLMIVGWHPTAGYFYGGANGTKINFTSGANTVNLEIK